MTLPLTALGRPRTALGVLIAFVAAVLLLLSTATRTGGETACRDGTVNAVAHPDDDLLFLSPDLLQDIRAGGCVTTIFLTAGDAGRGTEYWRARETGGKAAYAKMSAADDDWRTNALLINGHKLASATLTARPSIRLVFLRLPDGGVDGQGFGSAGLQQLWTGAASSLTSVDSVNSYSRDDLVSSLRALVEQAAPRTVRAMDFRPAPYGFGSGDHSDHVATAYFTEAALGAGHPKLKGYLGYHAAEAGPENVTGALLHAKADAFKAYAEHDPAISCQSSSRCAKRRTGGRYAAWLPRQYPVP